MVSDKETTFITKGGPYVFSSAPSTTSVSVMNTFNKNGEHTNILIGPSEYNEEREKRTDDVNSVWKKLSIDKFIPGQFRSVLDLFREALSCYQNGAYMASCIMCRTVTESLLYIAINSEYYIDTNKVVFMPSQKMDNGSHSRRMSYDDILEKAGKYLDDCAKRWLKKDLNPAHKETGLIRHSGDIVAHYSEKIDKEVSSLNANQSIEFWKDRASALDILNKTALAIQMVNDNYKSVNGIP